MSTTKMDRLIAAVERVAKAIEDANGKARGGFNNPLHVVTQKSDEAISIQAAADREKMTVKTLRKHLVRFYGSAFANDQAILESDLDRLKGEMLLAKERQREAVRKANRKRKTDRQARRRKKVY